MKTLLETVRELLLEASPEEVDELIRAQGGDPKDYADRGAKVVRLAVDQCHEDWCEDLMVHGFMGQSGINFPIGHPRSRDWELPNFPCKRSTCAANRVGKCVAPALCEIDEDGKCKGYKPGADDVD